MPPIAASIRPRTEIALWVVGLLVLPAVLVLLARYTQGAVRSALLALILLYPTMLAGAVLWSLRPRPWRPVVVATTTIVLAGLAALWALELRGENVATVGALLLATAGGGLLVLGLALYLAYRLGAHEAFLRGARSLMAAALLMGALGTMAFYGGMGVNRWDVREAKAWVEDLAVLIEETRRESGHYPELIDPLVRRAGARPRLVADDALRYRLMLGHYELGFDDPSAFIGSYVYRGPEGAWRHVTD